MVPARRPPPAASPPCGTPAATARGAASGRRRHPSRRSLRRRCSFPAFGVPPVIDPPGEPVNVVAGRRPARGAARPCGVCAPSGHGTDAEAGQGPRPSWHRRPTRRPPAMVQEAERVRGPGESSSKPIRLGMGRSDLRRTNLEAAMPTVAVSPNSSRILRRISAPISSGSPSRRRAPEPRQGRPRRR